MPVERLPSAEPDEHFVALAEDMLRAANQLCSPRGSSCRGECLRRCVIWRRWRQWPMHGERAGT